MSRPDVDVLEGLTTAIIVDQERMGANPRSTVGTATDANAMLRILFSRLAQPHIGSPNAYSFNVPSVRAAGAVTIERGGRTKTEKATFNRLGGMATEPTFEAGHLLADTIYREGRSDEVGAVLAIVESLPLTPQQRSACALTRAGDAYWNTGDPVQTDDYLDVALALAGSDDERVVVIAMRASLLAASRRYAEAAELVPICFGGPPGRHHVDAALAAAWTYRALGRGDEAITILDGVLDAYAAAIGQEASVMTMQVLLSAKSGVLVDLGRLDEAGKCVALTIAAAEATGERAAIAFAELSRGSLLMRRGRFGEAARAYAEADALIRAMHRPSMR